MNRFPGGYGPPSAYGPAPQQLRRAIPAAAPEAYHPARIAVGLLNQSGSRYSDQRSSIDKLDRAMSDFELGMGQLLGRVSPQDPAQALLNRGYQAIATRAQAIRSLYEQLCAEELRIQADIKRLMAGQPPSQTPYPYAQSTLPQQSPQQPQLQPQPQPYAAQPQQSQAASPLQQPPQPQQYVPPEAAAFFQTAAQGQGAQQPLQQPLQPGQIPTPYQAPPGVQVVPPVTYGSPPAAAQPVYQQHVGPQPPLQPIAQQPMTPQPPPPAAQPAVNPAAAATAAVIGAIKGATAPNGAPRTS